MNSHTENGTTRANGHIESSFHCLQSVQHTSIGIPHKRSLHMPV